MVSRKTGKNPFSLTVIKPRKETGLGRTGDQTSDLQATLIRNCKEQQKPYISRKGGDNSCPKS